MRSYELTCLFRPEGQLYEQNIEALRLLFEKNDIAYKNIISEMRTLAYNIEKDKSAYYWMITFNAPADFLKTLREFFLYNKAVLRYLLALQKETKRSKRAAKNFKDEPQTNEGHSEAVNE